MWFIKWHSYLHSIWIIIISRKKNKKTKIVYESDINKNKHWLLKLVIKYIILIIIRMFHYVRSSAINKDAQEGRWGRSHFGPSCQSGINQGAAQRVRGQKSKVTKFSQTSTSETQSKWLVQKSGSDGEGKVLGQIPPHHHLGYTKRKITLYYSTNTVFFSLLTYRLLFSHSDVGQSD